MAGYLYMVKDRQTGEILCQGSVKNCADFLGCENSYIRFLIWKQPKYKAVNKYSAYKVERQVIGEVKRGGAHKKDVICCDCGVLMVNASASQKRCAECARKRSLNKNRERRNRDRAVGCVANPKIKKADNSGCEGCIYFRGCFDINRCCNYYLDTGKRRPCAFGDGCSVRKEGDKRNEDCFR